MGGPERELVGRDVLIHLIAETYGPAEAEQFAMSRVSADELQLVANAGRELLSHLAILPGVCVYASAMWTAMLRDHGVHAYCIAGELWVRGLPAFAGASTAAVKRLGLDSCDWDGHCWIVVGEHIGDASIFRTAYAQPPKSNLRRSVLDAFGQDRGLMLCPADVLSGYGFDYRPLAVLCDDQIDSFIQSADSLGFFVR